MIITDTAALIFLATGESVTTVSEEIVPDLETDKTEKRRSVRAKRDKPDYYDALDYDSKRAKAIKGGGTTPKRGPPGSFGSSRISPGKSLDKLLLNLTEPIVIFVY